MGTKYFVWYTHDKRESFILHEFATEVEVVAFLNQNAGNSEFQFRVVRGEEIPFKPVKVATRYERA